MKKLLLLLLTISLSTVFAKGSHKSPQELCAIENVVLLTNLTPEITRKLLQGQLPSTAIECHENTNLPIVYLMNAPFFSLDCAPNLTIKILKNCYFRFAEKRKVYFSFDLITWEKYKPTSASLDATIGISADKSHFLVESNYKSN